MPNRGFKIRAGGCSAAGGRSTNQDAFGAFCVEGASSPGAETLFVVADGMGGHGGGDRASTMAVGELASALRRRLDAREGDGPILADEGERILEETMVEVDSKMQQVGQNDPRFSGMGTTLTAAWLVDGHLVFGHAGDSRLYRWRPDGFIQVTDDQNVAYRLWREGRLTEDEYKESPYRSALLSYVGGGKIEVQTGSYRLEAAERLLLATDGLIEETELTELEEHLAAADQPEEAARKLVRLAEVRGARDNVTALVVRIDPSFENTNPQTD